MSALTLKTQETEAAVRVAKERMIGKAMIGLGLIVVIALIGFSMLVNRHEVETMTYLGYTRLPSLEQELTKNYASTWKKYGVVAVAVNGDTISIRYVTGDYTKYIAEHPEGSWLAKLEGNRILFAGEPDEEKYSKTVYMATVEDGVKGMMGDALEYYRATQSAKSNKQTW